MNSTIYALLTHRWGYQINIMWAAHSPHQSAEEMNFIVALQAIPASSSIIM